MTTITKARLKLRYEEEIRPALVERFGYSSPMQAPQIKKITLNMGVGEAKQDSKMLEAAAEQLATIAGQKPSIRRSRISIAAFRLREGQPVGLYGADEGDEELRRGLDGSLDGEPPESACEHGCLLSVDIAVVEPDDPQPGGDGAGRGADERPAGPVTHRRPRPVGGHRSGRP